MASSERTTNHLIRQALEQCAAEHAFQTATNNQDDSDAATVPKSEEHMLLDSLIASNKDKTIQLQSLHDAAVGLLDGDAAAIQADRDKIETYLASIQDIMDRVTALETIVGDLDAWSRAVQTHVGKA